MAGMMNILLLSMLLMTLVTNLPFALVRPDAATAFRGSPPEPRFTLAFWLASVVAVSAGTYIALGLGEVNAPVGFGPASELENPFTEQVAGAAGFATAWWGLSFLVFFLRRRPLRFRWVSVPAVVLGIAYLASVASAAWLRSEAVVRSAVFLQ
jgi:hypothetical protein